ncbi:unnamed protein product [Calicophoron daubneyi]|uniref:Prenylcysteine lyase domain-containing protein n=1 Tax=Calicophoron daubneyi TaxID=300641 RepID=A0AAV2TF36_CALDB
MSDESPFRVAVIGGGMGGATTAYYLRKIFGSQISISLFEQSGRVGGRMHAVQFGGRLCETGGTFFHGYNQYMVGFAKQFNLPTVRVDKADLRMAFFGGHNQTIYTNIGGSSVLAPFWIFWRYGLSLIRASFYAKGFASDLNKIYRLQEEGHCFSTPAHMLAAMRPGFLELIKQNYGDWLQRNLKVDERFKDEVAHGFVCNIYGQGLDINALAGSSTLTNLLPNVLSLRDGNEQIPQNLVKYALGSNPADGPKELLHAKVISVHRDSSTNRLKLEYVDRESEKRQQDLFDYVVLALPMHQGADISVDKDVDLPHREYQVVDRGLVAGNLRYPSLGLTPGLITNRQMVSIMPTEKGYLRDGDCLFRSLMVLPAVKKDSTPGIWFTLSVPSRVADPVKSLTARYFEEIGEPHRVMFTRWLAYPVYRPLADPRKELGRFVLAPGFYYTGAMENALCGMENAAISGRNVALLIGADRKSTNESKTIKVDLFPLPQERRDIRL